MSLSQVMPSGCQFRRVAHPPSNLLAVADRPSASDYQEEQLTVTPDEMRAAVTTPVFLPYSGESGKAWMAKEHGVILDTSSFMSSEYERDETDDEILSFDLGPEPIEPGHPTRLPSDEWLDDHQQGLHPGGSEPRHDPYAKYMAMPNPPSIMDMMRNDMDTGELDRAPPPRARAPPQTMRWDFDFVRDEPPPVKRLTEDAVQTSTPRADTRSQNIRPRPALELPRPRASSAPPVAHPAKRVALQYMPTTEEITPPATPPRAQDKTPEAEINVVPDTPSPVTKHGKSRGRGSWRAPPKPTPAPGVGTRSMTRLAEIQRREDEEALAASARWPPSPDLSTDIQHLTREMHIRDVHRNTHAELESVLPSGEEGHRDIGPASSGWSHQQTAGYIFHSTSL